MGLDLRRHVLKTYDTPTFRVITLTINIFVIATSVRDPDRGSKKACTHQSPCLYL